MEWKEDFTKAVSCFRRAKYDESLKLLNQALKRGGDQQYVVYDSRAAVYEKLGKFRDALLDVKKAIQLAPNRWQCYSRAARLFLQIRKYEEALKMVELSLQKLGPKDSENREELKILHDSVLESRKRRSYHMGMLPVELLTEIFELLVLEDPTDVILISSVCGHWRRVAMSKPSLWDTLVLTKKDPIRKTAWWLQRSNGRIRRLCLNRSLTDNLDWSMEKLDDLKWDHLRVCHFEDTDIVKYLQQKSMEHILSHLEEVSVKDEYSVTRDTLLQYLGDNLRSLTIHGVIADLQFLRTHSLVSLKIQGTTPQSPNHFIDILSANPDLETLIVDAQFSRIPPPPESELILSRLTTLEFSYMPLSWVSSLALPSLKNLFLRYCQRADLMMRSMIESKYSGLESVTIISCNFARNLDLIELLSMSPNLTNLVLNRLSRTAKPVLEALCSPLVCPVLTHLDLSECPDVTAAYLMDVVKARLKASDTDDTADTLQGREQLVSLTVNGCPHIATDYLPWFRERVQSFNCVYLTKRAAGWKR